MGDAFDVELPTFQLSPQFFCRVAVARVAGNIVIRPQPAVSRNIDDKQPTRLEHPIKLVQRGIRIVRIRNLTDHIHRCDHIKARVSKGQLRHGGFSNVTSGTTPTSQLASKWHEINTRPRPAGRFAPHALDQPTRSTTRIQEREGGVGLHTTAQFAAHVSVQRTEIPELVFDVSEFDVLIRVHVRGEAATSPGIFASLTIAARVPLFAWSRSASAIASRMRSLLQFLDSSVGRVLRYAISIGLLAGFILWVDWSEIARLRGQFATWPVFWAVILAGISYPLHAYRWWLLLRVQGLGLSFHWSHVVTWIGNFYSSFLLGGLGGDAARAYYVCRDAPEAKAGGLAAIAIDRLLGLLILLLISLVAIIAKLGSLADNPAFRAFAWSSVAVLVAGTIASTVLLAKSPDQWPHWLRRYLGDSLSARLSDFRRRTLAAPGVHLIAFSISVVVWLLDFISVWLLALGVGLPLPFFETCIAVSIAYASTALPISIGGHGVREGALLFVLGLFGLIGAAGPDRERALILAVLVWAVTMIWSLFGGLVLVLTRQDRVVAPSP